MSEQKLKRSRSIRAFDRGDSTVVLDRSGSACEFTGASALLVRELLSALRVPRTQEELLAHLDSVAEGAGDASAVVQQALELLQKAGAVGAWSAPATAPSRGVQGRVVLGVSGAVAASHAPALVAGLQQRGFELRVAMTRSAHRFVAAATLRALTHRRVHTSLWAGRPDAPAPHLDLAEWADLVMVAPATATTLSRLASGDCSELVPAVALSTRRPVIVAPSMNEAMHASPAIARNIAQLVEDGFFVAHPSLGLEVEEAPGARRARYGSWPALEDLIALVEHVSRHHRVVGARETDWDAEFEKAPPEQLPFHTETLDADLAEVLATVKTPARLWDVGTGLGTVARRAAELGFEVTATDISSRALELAARRAQGHAVKFLVDDVRDSRVEGCFDVVVDRGCLHTLDPAGARRYLAAIHARTRPGSLLVLKGHREDEARPFHTARYRPADLEALFSPSFKLVRWSRSTLPGPLQPLPLAWLALFERAAGSAQE